MKTMTWVGDRIGMISGTILHYEIQEKLGDVHLVPRSGRDETRPQFNRTNGCELW